MQYSVGSSCPDSSSTQPVAPLHGALTDVEMQLQNLQIEIDMLTDQLGGLLNGSSGNTNGKDVAPRPPRPPILERTHGLAEGVSVAVARLKDLRSRLVV